MGLIGTPHPGPGLSEVGIYTIEELSQKCTVGVLNVLSSLALLLMLRKHHNSVSFSTSSVSIIRFTAVSAIAQ